LEYRGEKLDGGTILAIYEQPYNAQQRVGRYRQVVASIIRPLALRDFRGHHPIRDEDASDADRLRRDSAFQILADQSSSEHDAQMTNRSSQRPDPEQLLAQIALEERRKRAGRLKVFLGYAAGVGKSFQMFDEGRRRRERGEDVVVCAVQPSCATEVDAVLQKLQVIPTLKTGEAESIDVPAVIRRHPQVALIDGLAYENPPESSNAHRWQDVEQLIEAGISIITTVNLQYLEKLRDEVERITGKRTSCSIPRGFLDRLADEIVVVDAPAIESLSRGVAPANRAALLAEQHKLSRLRELALLVAAGVVDHQLESYLRVHGMAQPWCVQERILVCVTPRSNAAHMLESGRRNVDRFHGELYAVYAQPSAPPREDRSTLQQNLDYARKLGAEVEILSRLDAADILKFARQKGITQIFIGHSLHRGPWRRLWSNLIDRLIRTAEGIDVVVYPD
jgi:two-component system sensor histidine kinase KdpD